VWLEEYLKTNNKEDLCVQTHMLRVLLLSLLSPCSQDFLNGVCTHIIWLTQRKLTYYTGNYDTFKKTVAENEVSFEFLNF
jgi:ATP-binding cassette subfamily F protein 2